MDLSLYADFFSFLEGKNVKYTVDGNIVCLNDYNYSLFLVLESASNSVVSFNAEREAQKALNGKFLIFIWFDLWHIKKNVILSKITHLLGKSKKIHARKTSVEIVSKEECEFFFNENHLNQPVLGYKRIGLYLDSNLIGLASFAKRRKFRDDTYSSELLQFATVNGTHINGGLTKIIKYFRKLHSFDSLMTYIDLDWSSGEKFFTTGFVFDSYKSPVFFETEIDENFRSLSNLETNIFNLGSIKSVRYFEKL